jgi:hypothetical protein
MLSVNDDNFPIGKDPSAYGEADPLTSPTDNGGWFQVLPRALLRPQSDVSITLAE